jgi:hypothetical protein
LAGDIIFFDTKQLTPYTSSRIQRIDLCKKTLLPELFFENNDAVKNFMHKFCGTVEGFKVHHHTDNSVVIAWKAIEPNHPTMCGTVDLCRNRLLSLKFTDVAILNNFIEECIKDTDIQITTLDRNLCFNEWSLHRILSLSDTDYPVLQEIKSGNNTFLCGDYAHHNSYDVFAW